MHTINGSYADSEMADFFAEMWAEGASFFMYQSDSVDSLSSCCRLRNGIEDNTFSYTLGAGGIETGSKGVITMNLNRIVQDWHRDNALAFEKEPFDGLIFDSESDPGCPVSLRELCKLPEDVLIYVRGKNLLGRDEKSRNNLCYSRSCFTECAEELVEYFLSSRVVESGIFDFRHIITEFEPTQNSGPDGK